MMRVLSAPGSCFTASTTRPISRVSGRLAPGGAKLLDQAGQVRGNPLGLDQIEVAGCWLDEKRAVPVMLAKDAPIHLVREDLSQEPVANLGILEDAAHAADSRG